MDIDRYKRLIGECYKRNLNLNSWLVSNGYAVAYRKYSKKYISNENYINLESIDNYNLNGDYIESKAFGFLAIRSFLNLPISFSATTGCKEFTLTKGEDIFYKIAPECQLTFKIEKIKEKEYQATISHHDSPMGEYYKIKIK